MTLLNQLLCSVRELLTQTALRRLSVDAAGRLRVINTTEVTTTQVSMGTWGTVTAQARSQQDAHISFQTGYRRNISIT